MTLITSLPNECFHNILSFLDDNAIYKCLFVNRYYCRSSIPIIWKEPFTDITNFSIIPTLLACLNNDEISSLVPYAINFPESNPALFEYGGFVRYIDHQLCVEHIMDWLIGRDSNVDIYLNYDYQDCRVQGLVNAIYHMMMRQGSTIREFRCSFIDHRYVELPKSNIFKRFLSPGISNLRSLNISIDSYRNDMRRQNAIEFLRMVPTVCNDIVDFRLYNYELISALVEPLSNIIKLQSLRRLFIFFGREVEGKDVQKILYSLEFCPEAFKELLFKYLNFQDIDLSFISRLEHLDRLEIESCSGFTSKHYESLVRKQLHLKDLKLWFESYVTHPHGTSITSDTLGVTFALINSFGSEMLVKLTLDVVTLRIAIEVKTLCQNLRFLHIKFISVPEVLNLDLKIIIPTICELHSLKTLHIEADNVNTNLLIKTLGDHLITVEYLCLSFPVDIHSFQYFTVNCRANLVIWSIKIFDIHTSMREECLARVDAYQSVHKSLKVLGVNEKYLTNFTWTDGEMAWVESLNDQGVEVVLFEKLLQNFI